MPGKNIIVRMADRLRAGNTGRTGAVTTKAAADSFASRQNILARLSARLAARIGADPRFAEIKCIAKPDAGQPLRVMLIRGARIVTFRIAPDAEYFSVGGCGLGKRFSANPAHLQSDDIVLLAADEAGAAPFGTEFTAIDFLDDLIGERS